MSDADFVITQFSSDQVLDQYEALTAMGLWRSEAQLFKKYFPTDGRLLDVGCGAGRIAIAMAVLGYNVTGIDFVPGMIDRAKSFAANHQVNAKFEVGDATALEFADASFDIATFAYNGVNNIPGDANRAKAFGEIYRALVPNGTFYLSSHIRSDDDNLRDYWARQRERIAAGATDEELGDRIATRYGRTQYINLPSLSHLSEQLKNNGFDIEFHGRRDVISPDEPQEIRYRTDLFVCRATSPKGDAVSL